MKKVRYLPLDARPCNLTFPLQLFHGDDFQINTLDKQALGFKKTRADIDALHDWLISDIQDYDGLVVSLDMLIYGGLVPSRLHHDSIEDLKKRLSIINEIKRLHPRLVIYAFSMIMRCPGYNSDDEEPDYYKLYGASIFQKGFYEHKQTFMPLTENETARLGQAIVPEADLEDYLSRRKRNVALNIEILNYVESNLIDFLVIPQDDSAPFGYTALDQGVLRNAMESKYLDLSVFMYPGADEVGMTLMSRMHNVMHGYTPKVYIKYPAYTSGSITPNIEDRMLDSTVKYHIMVCNGIVVDRLEDADVVAYINAPADKMLSRLNPMPEGRGHHSDRNVAESFQTLLRAHKLGKGIIIGDIAYGNGSSLEMYRYLIQTDLLMKLYGYAGWNTASNAIGSAFAHGFSTLYKANKQDNQAFLVKRYIEDIAYCGYVRQQLKKKLPDLHPSWTYESIAVNQDQFLMHLRDALTAFIDSNMKALAPHVRIKTLGLPWSRMYEIDIEVSYE